ncbi:hypothetical protein COCON_G00226720 [Conger conger]|uniref:Chemokine interleukin-8-like domain-containing protein n=1 Tax=Conger conger TaxID=82655 RepID=A0A9Q1CWP0_CONCO|nr:hypothetical protein COCON_G00226720 [Conger conger]
MDLRLLAIMALLTLAMHTHVSDAKPISLVERCRCRTTVNNVPQRSIRNSLQVNARLKSNREVCINTETKWLQQYLKNALNKMKAKRQTQ